ncbi:N,N'-diacetylchitobiose phosphorylase, partial [bacterium]|nr:N,N'-diacetylchitobiose phosphorylase [bacterium]
MQYGYFDDDKKEYVITRPDTPQSWSNYLGSTEYGAIITNNAGGYGFYKSGAKGRFLRLRFNSVPMDQPGRYFYLRDRQSGDYWSASWQPVGKPLEQYASICRHGTAYTTIESTYSGIKSETTYFVPVGECFEYWRLKITNESDKPRDLSIFSFCEFTNQWNTFQDTVNLQYSLFIIQGTRIEDNLLRISIQDNLNKETESYVEDDSAMNTWIGMVGSPVTGYDTNREAFLGTYRGYHNPSVVENGKCSNSNTYGDNGCGSLQTEITLQPGECREVMILLGIGDACTIGKRTLAKFGSLEQADLELEKLKESWHSKIGSMTANTPDEEFNHTINMWGLYNCLITFAWSRAASLVYNGERDGLGYRDSVQDVLGVLTAI